MKGQEIPQTDSIDELAGFWDTHDLVDFEGQLEEVTEPVFERGSVVKIHLQPKELEEVKKAAKSKGVDSEELIREWVLEKIQSS